MTVLLGISQFIIISFICYCEVERKSPVMFLWAVAFVMFALPHLFTSILGDQEYSPAVLDTAAVFVLLFCAFYSAVRFILPNLIVRKKCGYRRLQIPVEEHPDGYMGLLIVFAVCIVSTIGVRIRAAGGILNVRAYMSLDYSYINANQIISILYYVLSGLALYYLLQKQHCKAIVMILLSVVQVIITRNRVEILPVLTTVIAFIIIRIRNISLIKAVKVIPLAIGALAFVYIVQAMRWMGSVEVIFQPGFLKKLVETIGDIMASTGGELGLLRVFYYFISRNNSFPDFGEMHTFLRMLLVFIPTRFSLGLKPGDFAHTMGAAMGMAVGGSTHPTLFGTCYANGGFWGGACLGAFWALYAIATDRIVGKQKSQLRFCLTFILLSYGYAVMGRGAVYNAFFTVAWGLLLLYVSRFLPKIRFCRKIKIVLRHH